MIFDQERLILNSFITSHFPYCPIVWMLHSSKLNEIIIHIHERALRIVYKDCNSSFQELLIEDNSLNICHRNLQKLMTEIWILKWLITWAHKWCFRVYRKTILPTNNFSSRKIRTTKYGIETPSYLGPKLWNLVPNEYKTIESLADFQAKIKTWVPENCPCRLCKTYIHQIGFI